MDGAVLKWPADSKHGADQQGVVPSVAPACRDCAAMENTIHVDSTSVGGFWSDHDGTQPFLSKSCALCRLSSKTETREEQGLAAENSVGTSVSIALCHMKFRL